MSCSNLEKVSEFLSVPLLILVSQRPNLQININFLGQGILIL